jgi:two-component system cell cycle response regulator DivK
MKKRVLIFDDDFDILQICAIVLKKRGYEVCTQNSSAAAIEQIRSFKPDVILMDNWIPGPGGIETTRRVKEEPDIQHIPVIFFSANSNVSQLAGEARADYSLQKPFDIMELERVVNQAITHAVTE